MIGERLRQFRQAQGRSLADIAGKAKVSVATLSRIENDKQSLELNLLVTLAKILQIAPAEFLNGVTGEEETGEPLARRIATLETKKRAELWRDLAADRRTDPGVVHHVVPVLGTLRGGEQRRGVQVADPQIGEVVGELGGGDEAGEAAADDDRVGAVGGLG